MTFTRRNVVQSQLNPQEDLSIDVASTEISGKITAHNDKASRKTICGRVDFSSTSIPRQSLEQTKLNHSPFLHKISLVANKHDDDITTSL
jgi:hypothetical protein